MKMVCCNPPSMEWSTSPMIKVMNDASIQVQKLVNSLTISPLSENKLKDKMVDSDEEDAIKTLLG